MPAQGPGISHISRHRRGPRRGPRRRSSTETSTRTTPTQTTPRRHHLRCRRQDRRWNVAVLIDRTRAAHRAPYPGHGNDMRALYIDRTKAVHRAPDEMRAVCVGMAKAAHRAIYLGRGDEMRAVYIDRTKAVHRAPDEMRAVCVDMTKAAHRAPDLGRGNEMRASLRAQGLETTRGVSRPAHGRKGPEARAERGSSCGAAQGGGRSAEAGAHGGIMQRTTTGRRR